EFPDIAWKLLLSLLPRFQQVSSYSRRPVWREMIADDWSTSVTQREYWEQVSLYAELAIDAAKSNVAKLADLIDRLDDLPKPAYEKVLVHLGSESILPMPEAERVRLWSELVDLTTKHRKFADTAWAMRPGEIDRIAVVAERLAPQTPTFR